MPKQYSWRPYVTKRRAGCALEPVPGTEKEIPADLVLIAAGFLGSESYSAETFGVKLDGRTNVETAPGSYCTENTRIFTAGDMHRGQSLVVWGYRRRYRSRCPDRRISHGLYRPLRNNIKCDKSEQETVMEKREQLYEGKAKRFSQLMTQTW